MERGLGRRPDPLDDVVVGIDPRAGLRLGIAKVVHRTCRHDAPHPAHAVDEDPAVRSVGQEVEADGGRLARVGRADVHGAAALGSQGVDGAGHARLGEESPVGRTADRIRREMHLHVRRLQPLPAPHEGEHRSGRKAQEPASGRRVAQHLPRETRSARTFVVGRATRAKAPHHARGHMVDEVLAHPRERVRHLDALRAQHLGPADPGQLEQLGRADRAAAEHHLPCGQRFFLPAVAQVADPGAEFRVEHEPASQRVGRDLEIRPSPGGPEVAVRGAHPPAAADRGLGLADAFLARSVVVRVVRQAELRPGAEQGVVERAPVRDLADPQRSALRAPFVRSALEVLHAPEERQDVVVAPAAIAELRPGVVVEPLATHEHQAVDGAGAPEQTPAGDRDRPSSRAFVGLGAEAPVGGRVVDELREADRHPAQPVTSRTRLDQQHPPPAVGREAIGEDAAGGPRAHDDEIELAFRHHPVSRAVLARTAPPPGGAVIPTIGPERRAKPGPSLVELANA